MANEYAPKNSENALYLYFGSYGNTIDFSELIYSVKSHFGEDISFDDLDITSDHIHTRCLTYDQYDSSDYDNYIVITRK